MRKNWKALMLAVVLGALTLVLLANLPAMAEQKHMEKALSTLKEARLQLENADRNKGGHRRRAVELIDQAINEVEKGIRYADTHDSQSKGGHHGTKAHHVSLDDLAGMKASNLDSTMESRGFTNKGGYKQHGTSYTTWWNASTEQCVSVATHQGEVKKVEAIFKGNCQ